MSARLGLIYHWCGHQTPVPSAGDRHVDFPCSGCREAAPATAQRACGGLCGCDGSLVCECMCHERFPEPVYSEAQP